MSYARNLLSRGEEVVYESRQHWFAVIARTWLWLLIAIVALAVVIFLVSGEQPILGSPELDQIITIVGIIAILLSAVLVGYVLWDWRNQEWLVTTRRVIRAEGVLNKTMADSSLEKINDARLEQSLFGRIFGYGTLDILTAAEEVGGPNIADFPMIADPVDFKKAMLDQKEMLERPDLARPRYQRPGQPPDMQRAEAMPARAGSDRVALHPEADAPAAEPSPVPQPDAAEGSSPADPVGETLERLAGLRDRGLITPDEYEAKKREILERM
ncbi:MAG TPA: PH domain-containing protein [Candidatus Limnocylindria bacterium]